MGLELAVTQPTKEIALHWEINDINICRSDAKIHVLLFGYKTKTDMEEGAKQMARSKFYFPFTEPFSTTDITADMQKLIKEHPDWAEAKDVLE